MTGAPRVGYVPALDGLRAVAVVAVLLFHGGASFATGGFLGVSVFFTLSGYLITSLLLAEHGATGTVSLGAFYARRARRLLPAAYACVAGVLAAGVLWGATQRRDLPGDALAALFNVANWRFAFAGQSYQDLFIGAPSPLAHFWSLAIEEQFYLVLPLVAVVALRRGRRTFASAVAVLGAASVAATLLTSDRDLVYDGTHTRAAELLAGVGLAFVVAPRPSPHAGRRRAIDLAGMAAAVGLMVLIVVVEVGDGWLYRGGLWLVAVCSTLVVAAAVQGGLLGRVLALRPLVAVGTVSYGLYLYHWPVFLALSPQRLGFGGVGLFALRVGVAALFTLASYRWLEQPVRLRRRLTTAKRALPAAMASLAAVAVAAVVVVPSPGFSDTERLLAVQEGQVVRFGDGASAAPGGPAPARPPLDGVTVLVVGTDAWPVEVLRAAGARVYDHTTPGCPLVALVDPRGCPPVGAEWPAAVRTLAPDVVVVSAGRDDRVQISRDLETVENMGELFLRAVRWGEAGDALGEAVARVQASGVRVVLADRGRVDDPVDDQLGRIATARAGLALPVRDPDALLAALTAEVSVGSGSAAVGPLTPPMRVLVIGDSTSLLLARALAEGGDGALDVLWAGNNGCPFVRVAALRGASSGPWTESTCMGFDERLPPLLESFRPAVVLAATGPTDLMEQRYPGDPTAHRPGDAGYVAFHETEMAALVALLDGTPLLVADVPPVRPGRFLNAETATAERLAALNTMIASWDGRWPRVAVFDYARPLLDYEAEHGSIRPDGAHATVTPLAEIAREVYVPALLEEVRALAAR